MSSRAAVCLSVSLLLCLGGSAQQAAKPGRKALLIVNSQYLYLTHLDSPKHDEAVLRTALTKTNFEVTTIAEDGAAKLARDYSAFWDTVKPGDCVLVFFSGYAVQVRAASGKSENFLLPLDFDPKYPINASRAFPLVRIFDNLEDSKASYKVILVDGARREEHLPVSGIGLADPELSGNTDTALLFSIAPGDTRPPAAAGMPGLMARFFAEVITRPGSDLGFAVNETSKMLTQQSGSPGYQLNQTGPGAFYFTPLPSPPPPPPPETKVIIEKDFTAGTNTKDRQDYVLIKKGSFTMGCVAPPSGGKDNCDESEKPPHPVEITEDFWMGQTEVTIDRYYRYADLEKKTVKKPKPPGWGKGYESGTHPIVNVSWEEAQAFCTWAGGRLPTEAQWEYAARAGKTQTYPYDSLQDSREKANFSQTAGNDRYVFTAPVKSFNANDWKLFDMAGNVWEWVSDWFSPTYYKESPKADPHGPKDGREKVYRGGSHSSDPVKYLRISYRNKDVPSKKGAGDTIGFRCVLPNTPEMRKQLGDK